jgi:hypothetical protein
MFAAMVIRTARASAQHAREAEMRRVRDEHARALDAAVVSTKAKQWVSVAGIVRGHTCCSVRMLST